MDELSRITEPLLDVLEVLLAAEPLGDELHGWSIMKTTGRTGPTIYGVLDRLEDAEWIAGRWEHLPPEENRPRRRLYRLTSDGYVAAEHLLADRRPSLLSHTDLRSKRTPRAIFGGLFPLGGAG